MGDPVLAPEYYIADALQHGVSQTDINAFLAGNRNADGSYDYHRLWTLFDVGGETAPGSGIGIPVGVMQARYASGAPGSPPFDPALETAFDSQQALSALPGQLTDGQMGVTGQLTTTRQMVSQAALVGSGSPTATASPPPFTMTLPSGGIDWGRVLLLVGIAATVVLVVREMVKR
jgi:hypothetical protein